MTTTYTRTEPGRRPATAVVPVDRDVLAAYLDGPLAPGGRRVTYLVQSPLVRLTVHDLPGMLSRLTFERLPARSRTGKQIGPGDIHPSIVECTSLNSYWSGITVSTLLVPFVLRRWLALEPDQEDEGTSARDEGADRRAPLPIPVEGIHLLDGQVVRVVRAEHGSGHLYASTLDPRTGRWEYVPGLASATSKESLLTADQAARYGRLYGRCGVCGRVLTDPESIDAGIGPVCVGYFGRTRAQWAADEQIAAGGAR